MKNDAVPQMNKRREFLKTTTLLAAAVAAGGSLPVLAKPDGGAAAISLEQCLSLTPEAMADSPLVQNAWRYLRGEIDSLKNDALRALTRSIYDNPAPSVAQRLDAVSRQQVWQELTAKGYTQQSARDFLPPAPEKGKSNMPFYAAPGSGYKSHHAYPGGLVTHVATNVRITNGIVETYEKVYGYEVDRDVALAAQLLHDLHKPYVFQWNPDGSSRTEQPLAGTGEHHILSAAELIHRKAPPELVIAQISAHQAASTDGDEKMLADWLEAAAIIAGVDPVAYKLVTPRHRPASARQEGFICHLGDHDYVLSVPAVATTLPILRQIAAEDYGISERDLDGKPFNALRNRLYSTRSAMRVHETMVREGKEGVRRLMRQTVTKA
ncbi:MAG: HD domain-containing protein [Candidatus Accumulibacter sp.]|jgi:hypothetical protein|nr:HD domain-containing protein [Accumulibacter sp.]